MAPRSPRHRFAFARGGGVASVEAGAGAVDGAVDGLGLKSMQAMLFCSGGCGTTRGGVDTRQEACRSTRSRRRARRGGEGRADPRGGRGDRGGRRLAHQPLPGGGDAAGRPAVRAARPARHLRPWRGRRATPTQLQRSRGLFPATTDLPRSRSPYSRVGPKFSSVYDRTVCHVPWLCQKATRPCISTHDRSGHDLIPCIS